MKFFGTHEEFRSKVESLQLSGVWDGQGKLLRFRAHSGEIINLYGTGTVQVQGSNQEAVKVRLAEMIADPEPAPAAAHTSKTEQHIFIVHGHDEAARNELELVLLRLNLRPFILQNSGAASKTIIESLEQGIGSNAAFGIVLLTPDDVGYSVAAGDGAAKPRARQNAILEMGMAMSALTRDRMVIIKKQGDMELPSDTDGILRLEYVKRVQEQVAGLVEKMLEAGIVVDQSLVAAASK